MWSCPAMLGRRRGGGGREGGKDNKLRGGREHAMNHGARGGTDGYLSLFFASSTQFLEDRQAGSGGAASPSGLFFLHGSFDLGLCNLVGQQSILQNLRGQEGLLGWLCHELQLFVLGKAMVRPWGRGGLVTGSESLAAMRRKPSDDATVDAMLSVDVHVVGRRRRHRCRLMLNNINIALLLLLLLLVLCCGAVVPASGRRRTRGRGSTSLLGPTLRRRISSALPAAVSFLVRVFMFPNERGGTLVFGLRSIRQRIWSFLKIGLKKIMRSILIFFTFNGTEKNNTLELGFFPLRNGGGGESVLDRCLPMERWTLPALSSLWSCWTSAAVLRLSLTVALRDFLSAGSCRKALPSGALPSFQTDQSGGFAAFGGRKMLFWPISTSDRL